MAAFGKKFNHIIKEAQRVALVGDIPNLMKLCKQSGVCITAIFTDGPVCENERNLLQGRTSDAVEMLYKQPVDVVFVTLYSLSSEEAKRLADFCADSATSIYDIPAHVGLLWKNVEMTTLQDAVILFPHDIRFDATGSRIAKRLFDITLAALLLVTIFPVLCVIVATGTKRSGAGSILTTKKQTDANEHSYDCWYFRTQHQADGHPYPMGNFIKRKHLYGWPRLLNVLHGEMSIVGPQLHQLMLDDWDAQALKRFMQRHHVKPGITGWMRVNALTHQSVEEKRQDEMYYVRHWSLWMDIRILWRTLLIWLLH